MDAASLAARQHALERLRVDAVDAVEAQPAGEEGLDGDLVGGVEHRGRAPARRAARPTTRCRPGKRTASASSNVSAAIVVKSSGVAARGRCARATPARTRSDPSCRACRAAPAPRRRARPTIEWMMLCGWITTSMRSGGRSNSQRASITSSALFIIVAESTEILRPITQFGCAQAWSGVTPPSVAGSRVRNGPPEAVSTMWSTRCRSTPPDRRQALEDGRVLAVDRDQRRPALRAPRR